MSTPGPALAQPSPCGCEQRPIWARVEDDTPIRWPVLEIADWEELRQCPTCSRYWFAAWPEEIEGGMILCRPQPPDARRLRDVDRITTLRGYCLARLEEHLGPLKEQKAACRKVACEMKRLQGSGYCVEHLIAHRFGRHLSKLSR